MKESPSWTFAKGWIPGLLLVVAIFVVYQPAWEGKPVWDDAAHLTPPELSSLHGLVRIWTEPGTTQQYYPLAYSTFWVEHTLWGDATLGYHWFNLLLHSVSALLLWNILAKLKVPGAFLATAIFALHPVCVESVAWISELKNTLSGTFYLGAALVYLRFDGTRSWTFYFLALALFLFGLMSKTVIATLPAALLLVFWWQRGRLSSRRDVLPLIPFFVIGIAAGLFTAWMEWKFVGARGPAYNFSFVERILIAGRVVWFYLGKLVWPVNLIFIYPRWGVSQTTLWQYCFPTTALLVTAGLGWLSHRNRGPLAAWLFFVGTLFPVLGFFNVYPFCYSFVADHFQYLAMIGPITLAAAGIAKLFQPLQQRAPLLKPLWCGAMLVILCGLSWRQSRMYTDVETLWRTTIARNPEASMAYNDLGIVLLQKGKADEALILFRQAIEIQPDNTGALDSLGSALLQQGHMDEALTLLRKAVEIQSNPETCNNLGLALIRQGAVDDAITNFRHAVAVWPDDAEAQENLGLALLQKGQVDEAIVRLRKAVAVRPDNAKAQNDLGSALLLKGQWDQAAVHFQKALDLRPDFPDACCNLGLLSIRKGQPAAAVVCFQKGLKLQPGNVDACKYLAWILATCPNASLRNGTRAVELAQQADQLSGNNNPAILATLAAAQAEIGHFADAQNTAQKALAVASAQTNAAVANALRKQIECYQREAPFRDGSLTNPPPATQ